MRGGNEMPRPVYLIFIGLILFLFLAGFLHPITAYTQDLGRHIVTGEIILDTFSVPKTNLFSYTYPSFPFVNHHWFSEVIFYLAHLLLGDSGLQWGSILLLGFALGIIFFLTLKKSAPLAVFFLSPIYLRILFERTDIRPEIFSFLLLSLFLAILYRYRESFTRWIFLLIPLELLWVNTHIYFFVGIVMLLLFLLDDLYRHRKNINNTHTRILGLVVLLCCLVTLLNPNGIAGALYPLRVFQNYGYAIEENQTIFLLESLGFQKPSVPYFKLAVFLLFTTLVLSYRKSRPVDWLLAITFTYAGAVAVRNFPLFALTTFIPATLALTNVTTSISANFFPKKYLPVLWLLVGGVLVWQITSAYQHFRPGVGVANGAERAVDFYQQQRLPGPLFNNFDIGSYLIYRLYPQERVFLDGRPEAYPKEFIQNTYIPIQQDQALFANAENAYGFTTIFFSHTDQTPWANQFLTDIVRNPKWNIVYLDDTVIILTKDKSIIDRFGMTVDALEISHFDPKDKQGVMQLASFFNKTGLTDYELQMYHHLLTLDPTHCPALYNTAVLLSSKNDPSASSYTTRYQQACRE